MFEGVFVAVMFLTVTVFSSAHASTDVDLQKIAKTFDGYEAVYDVTVRKKGDVKAFNNGQEKVRWTNGCGGFSKTGDFGFEMRNRKGGRLITQSRLNNTELPHLVGYHFSSAFKINSKPGPIKAGTVLLLGEDSYVVHFEDPMRDSVEIPGKARFPTGLNAEMVLELQQGKENLRTLAFDAYADYPVQQVRVHRLPQRFMPALFRQDPGFEKLKDLQGWVVDMSFYEMDENRKIAKEPGSRIVKDLYENGVSRNIRISYPNMDMVFRLRSIKWLVNQECK